MTIKDTSEIAAISMMLLVSTSALLFLCFEEPQGGLWVHLSHWCLLLTDLEEVGDLLGYSEFVWGSSFHLVHCSAKCSHSSINVYKQHPGLAVTHSLSEHRGEKEHMRRAR